MLLNGVSVENGDEKNLLNLVKALPTGFMERTAHRTDDTIYVQSDAYQLTDQAEDALIEWGKTKSPEKLEEAKNLFERALQSATNSDHTLTQAITSARYANFIRFGVGDMNHVMRLLTNTVSLADQIKAKDLASQYASELHATLHEGIKYMNANGFPPEQIEPWQNTLGDVRRRASKLFRNQYGEENDLQAHRVEQGEVGFSSKDRIGTDLLVQCVSPIFHNPETKQTAFSHIDHGTDIDSLEVVLKRLGYTENGTPLQVRLVGGNPDSSNKSDIAQSGFFQAVANNNISSLLEFLKDKNIDVISSDILDIDQPTAIVVDPQTFEVFERIPAQPNHDFCIANGRAMLTQTEKPLHVAFDLDISTARAPILVESQLAQTLNIFADQSTMDVYEAFSDPGAPVGGLVADRVENVWVLSQTHRAVVNSLLGEHLAPRIQELQSIGVEFDNDTVQTIINAIATAPIYVGENSNIANSPLIEFIKTGLIAKDNASGHYMIDLESLQNGSYLTNRASVSPDAPQFNA